MSEINNSKRTITEYDVLDLLKKVESQPSFHVTMGDVVFNITANIQSPNAVTNQKVVVEDSVIEALPLQPAEKQEVKEAVKKLSSAGSFKEATEGTKNLLEICSKYGPSAFTVFVQAANWISNNLPG